MTLPRMIVILIGGLVLLLAVVILRARTTELHYEISQCERRAAEYRVQLRAAELELARQRSPMLLRARGQRSAREFAEQRASATDPAGEPRP